MMSLALSMAACDRRWLKRSSGMPALVRSSFVAMISPVGVMSVTRPRTLPVLVKL